MPYLDYQRSLERKWERYRTDTAYRERMNAYAREYRADVLADPVTREVHNQRERERRARKGGSGGLRD